LRRMWARVALLVATSLVASQALVAAQVCWASAHLAHSAKSPAAPAAASHHEDTDRCPGAWMASDESVPSEPDPLLFGTPPAIHVFPPVTFASTVDRPAAAAYRFFALAPPILILYGNLRL